MEKMTRSTFCLSYKKLCASVALILVIALYPKCIKEPKKTGVPAQYIALTGPAAIKESEISGLSWHHDLLLLLPQYPASFYRNKKILFTLKKEDIISALKNTSQTPLTPGEMTLDGPDLQSIIPGFEGFEALACDNNTVYFTIEASPGPMKSYIIKGTVEPEKNTITLHSESLREITQDVNIPNASHEAIVIIHGKIITIFEANGINVNPRPRASIFDTSLKQTGTISFPSIEYRITDATAPDSSMRFWVINYYWPGEETEYRPGPDTIPGGSGAASLSHHVERLVCLQYTPRGISLARVQPLYFLLPGTNTPHNWEGIARLNDMGFLIITDLYPETVLAFVPYSE